MISINYTRLFNLRMTHTYFSDLQASGLKLRPTRSTTRLLKGANMLFKTIPNGVVILYRAGSDEITPVINLPPDQTFTFVLIAENPAEFQNITKLDVAPDDKFLSTSILHFTNDPNNATGDAENPEELVHSLIDSKKNSLFSYLFNLETSPNDVLLRITGPDGATVSAGKNADGTPMSDPLSITKSDDNMYRQQVDLRQRPAGLYTFTVRNSADDSTLKEERFYVDDELASQNFLGLVDIVYSESPGHIYGETEEYTLSFSRKETVWTYYIVNKNGFVVFDDHDLAISDPGSSDYPAVTFTREGDEPHADIQVNGYETVLFKSNVPIPFKDLPKPNVQLVRNPGSAILVKNLPNPSHSGVVKEQNGQLESEVYVFI
jgi:hypothetical protein